MTTGALGLFASLPHLVAAIADLVFADSKLPGQTGATGLIAQLKRGLAGYGNLCIPPRTNSRQVVAPTSLVLPVPPIWPNLPAPLALLCLLGHAGVVGHK